jgi:transposase
MNLILDTVISHITGATGLRIIQAILDGERRPEILAQYRDFRIKATEEEIAKSLEGTYREEHRFVLRQAYTAYQVAQQQISACDQAVETLLKKIDNAVDANHHPLPASTSSHRKPQGNEPTSHARSYVYEIYGVDLTQVPGFQASTVQTLLSEVGRDMTKWKTEKLFTYWLGLSPNANRSGGKDKRMKTRKVQSRAALAFRHAARAVSQSNSYLGAFYRRLRSRCGPSKALTATARKLAVIFYHMVKEGKEYQELGQNYYIKQHEKRQLRTLKTQAHLLGFELIPNPLGAPSPESRAKETTTHEYLIHTT